MCGGCGSGLGLRWSGSRCWWASGVLALQDIQHAAALVGEDLGGGTLGDDDALFQANDFGVEDEGFFDVVGDGEDGDALLCGVLLHAGKQDVAQGAIDAGEGFVEQDEVRCGDGEGSGQVDALPLSAGEIAGKAVGEWDELKEIEGCVGGGGWGWWRTLVAKATFSRTVRWGKRTAPCGA